MRYIITESRKEDIIKKFILSNFDRVTDVWFTTRSVYYGSGPVNGKDRGQQTIIKILVDNSSEENKLTNAELSKLRRDIISKTDNLFNLGYNTYGGGWEFSFNKLVIQPFG